MSPRRREPDGLPPQYSTDRDMFSIEVHHDGFFCGLGPKRCYFNSKVDWFDFCEGDTWSGLWIEDFVRQLKCHCNSNFRVYWCEHGKSVAEGLRPLKTDSDAMAMVASAQISKQVALYFDHCNLLERQGKNNVLTDEQGTSNVGGHEQDEPEDYGQKYGESDDEEWHDSDYEIASGDNDLWEDNVDEKLVLGQKNKEVATHESEEDDPDCDAEGMLHLPINDEDEMQFNFKSSIPETNMANPIFKLGMAFSTVEDLRQAINEYSIKTRQQLKKLKNDKKIVEVVCADEECPFYMWASFDNRKNSFVVKRFVGEHSCAKEWEIKEFTSRYMANEFIESFRDDDKLSLKGFAKMVQRKYKLNVSRSKLARARRLALKEIHGDEDNQYNLLWDYAEELRSTNPGSSLFLSLNDINQFSTLYVSLDACKRGWLKGCRPIICLDGTHIKTKYGGQLLTAVGVDPNNSIYPIAMGVVEV
ncbi:unnamed protein product [Urochloa humidicola]